MEPITVGIIGTVCFLLLMVVGVPIGISMALVGFAGFAYLVSVDAALSKIALTPFSTMIDFNFAVVPAFILMAQVFGVSGLGSKLYDLCEKILGRFRGGLALATILAAAIFAAISSSTVATVVTIGVIAIPEMMRRKYNSDFAGATVAAAGGLGILIPPSSILILYGLMTEQSIQKLFIAGIVPGMLLVLAYLITVIIMTRLQQDIAPAKGPKYSGSEIWQAFLATWETLLLIVICIGGLTLGWFTPTEAGAVGASGAILIAWFRKKLTWKALMESLLKTAANSGMVGLILIGAFLFNFFVTVTEIPQNVINTIGNINASPFMVMLIVTIIYLLLGMFMDSLSMLLLTIPFMFPIAAALGYSPIWFGIYCVMVMEMAVITPPIGMNLFATAGLFNYITVENIMKKIAPFVIAQFVIILLLLLWPEIATFLPDLLTENL